MILQWTRVTYNEGVQTVFFPITAAFTKNPVVALITEFNGTTGFVAHIRNVYTDKVTVGIESFYQTGGITAYHIIAIGY